jgi:hypothetical protein
MSYFPESKRNFKIENIYNGSRDGWHYTEFEKRVFNKGPTLIVLKTTEGAICGGYTSKNWDGSHDYTDDIDAFVFNMTHKYIPNNSKYAIYTQPYGFDFGECIL